MNDDKWFIRKAIWLYKIETAINFIVNRLGLGKLSCRLGRHEMWLLMEDKTLKCTRCGKINNLFSDDAED